MPYDFYFINILSQNTKYITIIDNYIQLNIIIIIFIGNYEPICGYISSSKYSIPL